MKTAPSISEFRVCKKGRCARRSTVHPSAVFAETVSQTMCACRAAIVCTCHVCESWHARPCKAWNKHDGMYLCIMGRLKSPCTPELDCRRYLTAVDIARTGDKQLLRAWERADRNAATAIVQNLWRCPKVDCIGEGLLPYLSPKVQCPCCNNCFPVTLSVEDHDVVLWMQSRKGEVAHCPACNVITEKSTGCDSMRCSFCRTVWCLFCKQAMADNVVHQQCRTQFTNAPPDGPAYKWHKRN
eukprot:TRINITY_DN15682_c0_g1_i1.p1 TRINITY_DN15682_c0_g1~~TRINITY_DN15682_c0_g1_i1.p1  ORF type:complete len:241 (-),score=8.29 TRINITY_DN15682_c0_g1_i1:9-731(-)